VMQTLYLPPGNERAYAAMVKHLGGVALPREKHRLVSMLADKCVRVIGDDGTDLTRQFQCRLTCDTP
jgi:hypothetical protein